MQAQPSMLAAMAKLGVTANDDGDSVGYEDANHEGEEGDQGDANDSAEDNDGPSYASVCCWREKRRRWTKRRTCMRACVRSRVRVRAQS